VSGASCVTEAPSRSISRQSPSGVSAAPRKPSRCFTAGTHQKPSRHSAASFRRTGMCRIDASAVHAAIRASLASPAGSTSTRVDASPMSSHTHVRHASE
jgi:hypothetical protein